MYHVSIALGLYNVRTDLANDFEGVLKQVKEMGYDGVEFARNFGGRSAAEIRDLCKKYELTPIAAHIPIEELVEDESTLPFYQEIGIEFAVIPYLPQPYKYGEENYPETVKQIKAVQKRAAEMGMTLCYHNHDSEFAVVDGKRIMDRLLEDMPEVQPEFDSGWIQIAGCDPVEYIHNYKDRIQILQFKDYVGEKKIGEHPRFVPGFCFTDVGSGKLECPRIMKAAKEIGVRWIMVEQDWSPEGKTDLECAKLSLDYLRGLCKEV